MVASFADNKDYKTYYDAAQLLLNKRNDITFLAIGRDTDSKRSESLIAEKHKSNFRLLGKISNVESFVSIMDICVLSTFTEGISNAILEYMAMGKVVIASAGGGTNEIVEDNKTGFLISPSDPNQLSEKIELLLGDIELRKNMGRAGRQRIEDDFSIDNMVNKFVAVYKNFELNSKHH
jgi:glycosyltransferase involved in cell wall biosynthesis